MRPLARSALRVWRKRPAGPVLLALGLLFATVLASGSQLALEGASQAEEQRDARELGDRMARVHTPGGFSLEQATLEDLQQRLAAASQDDEPVERRFPVFMQRDAIVTTEQGSSSDWTVLGLPRESLEALDVDPSEPGAILVDPPDPGDQRLEAAQTIEVRIPKAPQENVSLASSRQGQLERTVLVGEEYQHAEGDVYRFQVPVREDAALLNLSLTTAEEDTDFDLEAQSPTGDSYLDDEGTPAEPAMPHLAIEEPAPGNWTVEVHAKFAQEVAFRLEIQQIFQARDAQTLGRLLEGEGFQAIGAQLGLTEQAVASFEPAAASLERLGPGAQGLLVLPLERLQAFAGTGSRADGLLVMATPEEDVLAGLEQPTITTLEGVVDEVREEAGSRLDPTSGLALSTDANERSQQRKATLDSTSRLLFVVLPAGVAAGVLLATWAAGLHTTRLASELRVMAGLGQRRVTSAGLVAAHLGPPFVLGTLTALALAPIAGVLVARGIGLSTTPVLWPGPQALAVPLLAAVPIAITAWLRLRKPVRGQDPRTGDRPPASRARWIATGVWVGLAVLLALAYGSAQLAPARGYLVAALAACAGVLALVWAPSLESILSRPRSLSVANLGWFRTRSTHGQLALAAATTTLVLAALLAGTALSQAASPDPELESGGYPVISTTPTYVAEIGPLAPEQGELAERAGELASASLGTEYLMRVEGTGLHSADTGSIDRLYGIDVSFAQRHAHHVEPVGAVEDPFARVAASDDAAVVSRDVWEALEGEEIFVHGPQGRLPYDVVGIVDTRVLDGVYLSTQALPAQFAQIGGEQRFLLGTDTDPATYAAELQDVFKDAGLRATTANALVEDELAGQKRAGTTLSAMAGLGVLTALLLVVLIGIRAGAERRTSDAVLVSMGSPTSKLAAGIAVETALPIVVGTLVGVAVLLPAAGSLDQLQGLAFPLLPIDEASLAIRAALVLLGLLLVTLLVAAAVGIRAVRGLDQQALRELG